MKDSGRNLPQLNSSSNVRVSSLNKLNHLSLEVADCSLRNVLMEFPLRAGVYWYLLRRR